MTSRWTPVLAPPALLLIAAACGLAGYRLTAAIDYPIWAMVVAGAIAGYAAWTVGDGRYSDLRQRQRQGGPPSLDALAGLLARLELLFALQLLTAAAVYRLAAGAWPDGPLAAFFPDGRPDRGTELADRLVREMGRLVPALLAVGAVQHVASRLLFPDHPFEPFARGRQLSTAGAARRKADRARPPDDPGLPWGACRLPSAAAVLHWLVVGTTGSGKTLTLRLLMQDALRLITPGSDARALVYDAKRDALPLLAGMGLSCPVKTLNPLDERGVAWAIARDCTAPATAVQLAEVFVPDQDRGDNGFFAKAVRDLLSGVFTALDLTAPRAWTLRDVVLAMTSPRLRELLDRFDETRDRLRYFADDRTLANIMATVSTELAPYRAVAAAWDRAPNAISLADWVRGEFVLVLGNDESVRAPLDAINRAIVQRATELLLNLPESSTRRVWLFLDEVREAGRLDGLRSLLNKGRSKGACVVLGCQAIEGLWAEYGRDEANEIAGECNHAAFLRVESPETARWMADRVGEFERREVKPGQAGGAGQTSLSEDTARRPVVLPSEFQDLPVTDRANGLTGYYLSPVTGVYRHTTPSADLTARLLPPDANTPDHVPRPADAQYLRPWDADDLRRLGFAAEPPPVPPPPAPTPQPDPKPRLKVVKRQTTDRT
ncbi:MAG: hypothetical protein C0501_12735 [Isosphaera sp.]|nr:hypothetical protein [Isosphaera sp.]